MKKILLIILTIALVVSMSISGFGCSKEPASETTDQETVSGETSAEETETEEATAEEATDGAAQPEESDKDYVPQSVDDQMWMNISNFLTQFYLTDDLPNMTDEDKKFQFYIFTETPSWVQTGVVTRDTYEPGQWYHLAGVVDDVRKTVTLYVNGQSMGSDTYPGTLFNHGTNPYMVGNSHPGLDYSFPFKGMIDDAQIYDRALIVVTSDHGEEFADHGAFWHGTSLYQELVHVPLIVRFPGGAGSGGFQEAPVSLVDLMPTALNLAGIKAPAGLPGAPLSFEPATSARVLYAEEDHQGFVMRGVKDESWKLVQANPENPRNIPELQLFNLAVDPGVLASALAVPDVGKI